jgi:hypothetical protein
MQTGEGAKNFKKRVNLCFFFGRPARGIHRRSTMIPAGEARRKEGGVWLKNDFPKAGFTALPLAGGSRVVCELSVSHSETDESLS